MIITWFLLFLLVKSSGIKCIDLGSVVNHKCGKVLHGLYRNELSAVGEGIAPSEETGRTITLDQIRSVNECLTPELQKDVWYAPIVFFKRYKNLSQIYKQCSISRIKTICRKFSDIIKCPVDPATGDVLILSQGKEASTIFATIRDQEVPSGEARKDRGLVPRSLDNGSEREAGFELFSGCVYELGTKSSLRVRCLRSKKVEEFPLKLVIKVDGRTSDFLYHFNHELIVYSRIASSIYGSARVRLHPNIYSIFLSPERRVLANDLLVMEFIEGPALSSIIYKLTSVNNTLKYLREGLRELLEDFVRRKKGTVQELEGGSHRALSLRSKIELLENEVNVWLNHHTNKTILFSLKLYRRLLYLLDLFHRGGRSYYPEQKADFSRGRWKHQRSFKIHCDFHQGNILVKLSGKYRDPVTGTYNLTYPDMLNISLYNDLKIIDLEDAVEIMESDFPVPIDRFVATHPCPVYLSDAESFSSRFLSNIISIPNTLIQTYKIFQEYLTQNGTAEVVSQSTLISDWLVGEKEGNETKSGLIEDLIRKEKPEFLRIEEGPIKKIKFFSNNWTNYLSLVGEDEIIRPCFSYYHIKYFSGAVSPLRTQIPSYSLPCSWLSNIVYSQRACEYLEMAHSPKNDGLEDIDYQELRDLYADSKVVKCKIDEQEAMNVTSKDISDEILEYIPSISDLNETKWGDWRFLLSRLRGIKETDRRKKDLNNNLNDMGSKIIINLSSKPSSGLNTKFGSNKIVPSSVVQNKQDRSSDKRTDFDLVSRSKSCSRSTKRKSKCKPAVVFGSTDYSKESNLSGTLNWVEISQTNSDYNITGGQNQSLQNSTLHINNKVLDEFEKLVIELMGLAALQRIVTFCLRFRSEIDCGDVGFNKITRDGPIAHYLVKLKTGNHSQDSGGFSDILSPCIFNSNKLEGINNTTAETSWICSEATFKSNRETANTLKLIVDGRLFLDANQTFIDNHPDGFAFKDVLEYFSVNDTHKYTNDFNLEAANIIRKHKQDAILFWESETKLRNLEGIMYSNFNTSNGELENYLGKRTLDLVFPRIYIFHQRNDMESVLESKLNLVNENGDISIKRGNLNLTNLPLSRKKNDLSKQITSMVQTGVLTENVFFIENPPNVRFTTVLQKVSSFPSDTGSLTWISYSTLILALVDSLLRSHSYQMILAFMSLEFLREFRRKVDFDILVDTPNSGASRIIVKNKKNTVPIICNFSLRKMTVSSFDRADLHTKIEKLRNFKIFNTSGAKFVNVNDYITQVCPQESLDQIDLQNIFTELVLTSLDPISSLKKAVSNLSNIKFNSSIEVRRSNWFVKTVCKHIISRIEEIVQMEEAGGGGDSSDDSSLSSVPILLKSLVRIIIKRNEMLRSNQEIFKCIFFTNVDPEFKERTNHFDLNLCKVSDYIGISDFLYDKFIEVFDEQRDIFRNVTSLHISQQLIEYTQKHLDIPLPSDETPPPGGLGFLNERKNQTYNLGCMRDEKVLYGVNDTVAFDIKWPLMADIWRVFQQ